MSRYLLAPAGRARLSHGELVVVDTSEYGVEGWRVKGRSEVSAVRDEVLERRGEVRGRVFVCGRGLGHGGEGRSRAAAFASSLAMKT